MITFEGVDVGYDGLTVLRGLELTVRAGETTVLFGRNGSGKSTLLKSVLGIEVERAGRIVFEDTDISTMPANRIARRGIGYVPEDRRVYPLSVRDNLRLGYRGPRRALEERTEAVCSMVPLVRRLIDQRGDRISGGEQQAVSIARALMADPRLLLVDEASEGLAPVIVEALADVFLGLKRQGATILMAEQNLQFARRVADRVLVMVSGVVTFDGTVAELDAQGLDRLMAL